MTPPQPPFHSLLHLLILDGPNTCVHLRGAERTHAEMHTSLHLHFVARRQSSLLLWPQDSLSLRDCSMALPVPVFRRQPLQSNIKPVGGCQPLRTTPLHCHTRGEGGPAT